MQSTMRADAQPHIRTATERTPIDSFYNCHSGIFRGLNDLSTLSPLCEAAQRVRTLAHSGLDLFDHAVLEHHAEEEQDLFTAVLRSAKPGEERTRVEEHVHRLTKEHREIEGLWKRLRPEVAKAAAGKPAAMAQPIVDALVNAYRVHAGYEEAEFLPLAQEILGRNGNHMAALGLTLHMRHALIPLAHI